MISFSQILVLLFLALLLFGDARQIFNKFILIFINLKTLIKKLFLQKKDDLDSTKK